MLTTHFFLHWKPSFACYFPLSICGIGSRGFAGITTSSLTLWPWLGIGAKEPTSSDEGFTTTVGVGTMTGVEEGTRGYLPNAAPGPQENRDLGGGGTLLKNWLIEQSAEIASEQLKGEQRKEVRIQNFNDLTRKRWIKVVPAKSLGSKNAPIRQLFVR